MSYSFFNGLLFLLEPAATVYQYGSRQARYFDRLSNRRRKSTQNGRREGKTAASPPFFLLTSLQKRHEVAELAET
jgi:hypothetical protein